MVDEASEVRVREELWISFGSLIRSYVAASQLGREIPEVLVAEPEAETLQIVGAKRTVSLEWAADTGQGYWAIHALDGEKRSTLLGEGAFRIGLDGLVEWTGRPGREEMDSIAIALAGVMLEGTA